jgi:hypothetical protein
VNTTEGPNAYGVMAMQNTRQHLRGWAKNVSGQYKKEKKEISNTLDMLDKKAESIPL